MQHIEEYRQKQQQLWSRTCTTFAHVHDDGYVTIMMTTVTMTTMMMIIIA